MIDVSNYNGKIDWKRVRAAGVDRAYIKLTEGLFFVDKYAKQNAQAARAAGVQVGFYHFAHPSNSPVAEGRHFLQAARGLTQVGDLPPVLDLEVQEGKDWAFLNDWKAQYLALVDDAVPCHAPHATVFYSYYYFLKNMNLYPDRPVWGAAYGGTFTPPPTWSVWQYSSTGKVPGIGGYVDLDKVLRDLPAVANV